MKSHILALSTSLLFLSPLYAMKLDYTLQKAIEKAVIEKNIQKIAKALEYEVQKINQDQEERLKHIRAIGAAILAVADGDVRHTLEQLLYKLRVQDEAATMAENKKSWNYAVDTLPCNQTCVLRIGNIKVETGYQAELCMFRSGICVVRLVFENLDRNKTLIPLIPGDVINVNITNGGRLGSFVTKKILSYTVKAETTGDIHLDIDESRASVLNIMRSGY